MQQVALEAKLTASYKREEACRQQLQSRAVSAAGAQVGLFSQDTNVEDTTVLCMCLMYL